MVSVYKSFNKDSIYKVYIYHVVVGNLFWTNLSEQVIDNSIDNCEYIKRIKTSDRNFLLDKNEMLEYLKETHVLRKFIIYEFEDSKE